MGIHTQEEIRCGTNFLTGKWVEWETGQKGGDSPSGGGSEYSALL